MSPFYPSEATRPTKLSVLLDILLWLMILGLAGWGVYYFLVGQYEGRQQVIHLHFRDANEISKGAAVKMMGTDLGYVDGIKLHKDFVDITVKTYPDSIKVPSGSTFTVLFTGLVGSKSIEIIPPPATRPNTSQKTPQYLVENPIRLRQTLQYQIDIAQQLKEGAENFTNIFGNEKPIEILQYNILRARDGAVSGNQYLQQMSASVAEKQQNTHHFFNTINESLADFNEVAKEAEASSDPKYLEPALYASLRYLGLLLKEGQATMMTFQSAKGYQHIMNMITDIQLHVDAITKLPVGKVEVALIALQNRVDHFEKAVSFFSQTLDSSGRSKLHQLRLKVLNANEKIQRWNHRLKH